MTQQSYPNNSEEVAVSGASSSTNSASTSSTDVYPLPFSIGQKEIVLNNDERSLVAEVPANDFLAAGTNVCVTNSSNVDVGHRTTFNEPVTIYQYIQGSRLAEIQDGAIGHDEVECNKNVTAFISEKSRGRQNEMKGFEKGIKRRHLYIVFSLITVISLITATVVSVLIRNVGLTPNPQANATFTETTLTSTMMTTSAGAEGTPVPVSDTEVFVYKESWGGVPVINAKIPPATLVVIKHTGGSVCNDTTTCRARVRDMQKKDMEDHQMPDIRYNFLIGGDGKIYVGRGWRAANEGRNDSLDIAFIGNFSENRPSRTMLSLGKTIVFKAPWNDDSVVYETFRVVNHNQTEMTDSPGENLYKEVIHWNHYSNKTYFDTLSTGDRGR